MPLALLIIGSILIVSSARGTITALGVQLREDLFGDKTHTGFVVWIGILALIGTVGALGEKNSTIRLASRAFMALVVLALILRTPNLFDLFLEQIKLYPTPATPELRGSIFPGDEGSAALMHETTKSFVQKHGDIILDVSKLGTRSGL